jgi:hypothetical protein
MGQSTESMFETIKHGGNGGRRELLKWGSLVLPSSFLLITNTFCGAQSNGNSKVPIWCLQNIC